MKEISDLAMAVPIDPYVGDVGAGADQRGADDPQSDAPEDYGIDIPIQPTGSGLTEREIFDCLAFNFRGAADKCKVLAWHPRRGQIYLAFVEHIERVEGACRQAAAHREDARWLAVGIKMAEVHRRVGRWIRGLPTREGRARAHKLFMGMATALDKLAYDSEQLRDGKTGIRGIILPESLPGPHRDTRPVAVMLPSGLIIPSRVQ